MINSQDPEDDLYYFETDHLALRGDKDYSEVLKTLMILLSQRERAIKDYNLVVKLKKEALDDPIQLLEKIAKGESLGIPDLHCVPEIPVIDWSKYSVKVPKDTLDSIYSENSYKDEPAGSITPKKNNKINQGKWTTDEQKRLEELLQIYPPEPVEMRRFKKIANALGNRTIQQVASRLQKYFLKLYKAGMPVPGRIPKSAEKFKKAPSHKHQRHNHYLWKPTTFFPELCVPVVMNDLDCAPGPSTTIDPTGNSPQPSTSNSSNYLIQSSSYHQEESKKSEIELQLDLLKRIRQDKIRTLNMDLPHHNHLGFKCDFCGEEPITGTRWHCVTCRINSVDFCTDCVLSQLYSDNCHPLNHNLLPFSDDKCNVYASSDSESNSGSGNNVNNGSSDVDSDSYLDDVSEMASDDEMVDESEEQLPDIISNGLMDNVHDDKLSVSHVSEGDEFYCDDLETGLFTEIGNVSYSYLHSNLLFDRD